MILRPVVSEKAINATDEANTYVFAVPKSANKHEIARAISKRFEVTVIGVRTAINKGKIKQMPIQRGRKVIKGQRSDTKKAYVTLKSGDSITLFEGSE